MKGDFLTENNLRMSQPLRLKSDQIAEISHTNHILLRRFQGAFSYYDIDFLKTTKIPFKLHTA